MFATSEELGKVGEENPLKSVEAHGYLIRRESRGEVRAARRYGDL